MRDGSTLEVSVEQWRQESARPPSRGDLSSPVNDPDLTRPCPEIGIGHLDPVTIGVERHTLHLEEEGAERCLNEDVPVHLRSEITIGEMISERV